jgi:PIN domain nuclease of toxin-antitoxin system
MVTYVLDISAPIRFLDQEAGWQRVGQILTLAKAGQCGLDMSAVNWGELIGSLTRRRDQRYAFQVADELLDLGLVVIPADADRAARSGLLRARYNIGYADCFGLELAASSSQHTLVTADYGVKPAEHDIRIEFLPTKPRP